MTNFGIRAAFAFIYVVLASAVSLQSTRADSNYTSSMFARAVRLDSTSALFVLIMVRDSKTDGSEEIAILAPQLLWAISVEKHIDYNPASLSELRRIATSQPSRTFVFTSSAVLERLEHQYTLQQLREARDFVQKLSSEELTKQIRANNSDLHSFYSHRNSELVGPYENALAHALLERGVLVGIADFSGRLYLP